MANDDEQQANTVELHPKRTTSFARRRKKKSPVCCLFAALDDAGKYAAFLRCYV